MKHLDLFAGIGGFSLAIDRVWPDAEHVFVENDEFCQKVLKKHWLNAEINGDINDFMQALTDVPMLEYIKQHGLSTEKQIRKLQGDIRTRSFDSGNRSFFRYNETGDAQHPQTAGDKISSESALRKGQSFSQGEQGRWSRTKHSGICDTQRDSGKESGMRGMQKESCDERRADGGAGASSRLQQTVGSDVAMPELSSRMAQKKQSNSRKMKYAKPFILTAGVPCQPASQAGRRQGTDDNRWLWPHTFAVIRETRPTWCILENVRGILTLDKGMVFEALCVTMENLGYSVQSFVIPACSVGAPHKRDRVWIVANSGSPRLQGRARKGGGKQKRESVGHGPESLGWDENWVDVATRLCAVDDGVSSRLARPRGWRKNAIQAAGNSIVPQVAEQIFKAIKQYENTLDRA